MTTEELIAKVGELDLDPEDLDEFVHEAKAEEASKINNGGLDVQVEYLVECFGIEHAAKLLLSTGDGGPPYDAATATGMYDRD
jgi:hypothetical protein